MLAGEDAGPPTALDQLRSTGVAVEIIPSVRTVDGAKATLRAAAAAAERTGRGERLVHRPDHALDNARAIATAPRDGAPPRVMFVYARGSNLVMASRTDTGPAEMIRLAGGVNAITDYDGYRPLSAEAVARAAPDVVLIPARGLDGLDAVVSLPGVELTPAGKARRVVAIDDQLLLAFGPRLGDGVAQLARALR